LEDLDKFEEVVGATMLDVEFADESVLESDSLLMLLRAWRTM
jgi:hypothetical protein